jgi:probable HAF family extracellular repeat protein
MPIAVARRRRSRTIPVHVVTLIALASAAPFTNQALASVSFVGLGTLPTGTYSQARGISGNGSVAVGLSNINATSFVRAYRWSSGGGMTNLGTFPGGDYSIANAANPDGSAVVGFSNTSSNGLYTAFRWTSGGGMTNLGTLPGTGSQSYGQAVSTDGSVVVGEAGPSSAYRAFRWSSGTGMVDLGTLPGHTYSEADAVSGDGSVVVGRSGAVGTNLAYRWTSATGMQSLGTLPGGTTDAGAFAITRDASVIVGYSNSSVGRRAFRWTQGTGMVSLGVAPGSSSSFAAAVSGDGSAIVGDSGLAAYWTASLGMVNLNTYLPTLGINLSGWSLTSARGISEDGLTITGIGDHNGNNEAWVVTIPGPGSAALLALAGAAMIRRRSR